MSSRASALLAVSGLLVALAARAQAPESPLDVAQRESARSWASRLASLESGTVAARQRAIRGIPFGPEPEVALPALARIAAGRDPTCAPTAAVAALRIASELDAASLDAHEADRAALAQARGAFAALARDATARADLRALAARVAALLADLG